MKDLRLRSLEPTHCSLNLKPDMRLIDYNEKFIHREEKGINNSAYSQNISLNNNNKNLTRSNSCEYQIPGSTFEKIAYKKSILSSIIDNRWI